MKTRVAVADDATRVRSAQPSFAESEAAVRDEVAAEATNLASSPIAVILIWGAWMGTGLVVAGLLGRRGHDQRAFSAMGLALGPFMIGIALGTARRCAASAQPIQLQTGHERDGDTRVLIGATGSGRTVAEAVPLLKRLGDAISVVTIAGIVDYEAAESPHWCDRKAHVAEQLDTARAILAEFDPGLVMLAGEPRSALRDYAASENYDRVLIVNERNPAGLYELVVQRQ